MEEERVKVYLRVREEDNENLVGCENSICLNKDFEKRVFRFDKVFKSCDDNGEIFESVGGKLVEDLLSGYNCSILSYGQTGSGKTYTMFNQDESDWRQEGLVRSCLGLIVDKKEKQTGLKKWRIVVESLQIYQEKVYDLLDKNSKCKNKKGRQREIENRQDLHEIFQMI